MFGRHIWDFAQHADALGRRTFELRQPAQQLASTPLPTYRRCSTRCWRSRTPPDAWPRSTTRCCRPCSGSYRRYADDGGRDARRALAGRSSSASWPTCAGSAPRPISCAASWGCRRAVPRACAPARARAGRCVAARREHDRPLPSSGALTLREPPARDACFTVVLRDAEMHEYDGRRPAGPARDRAPPHEQRDHQPRHRRPVPAPSSRTRPGSCAWSWPASAGTSRATWRSSHRRLRELGGPQGRVPHLHLRVEHHLRARHLAAPPGHAEPDLRGRGHGRGGQPGARPCARPATPETAEVLRGHPGRRGAPRALRQPLDQGLRRAGPARAAEGGGRRALPGRRPTPRSSRRGRGQRGRRGPWTDPAERVPAVNVEDRRLAEFTDEEIHEILRQAGFRSLLPRQDAAAMSLDPRLFAPGPARDARFAVSERWSGDGRTSRPRTRATSRSSCTAR